MKDYSEYLKERIAAIDAFADPPEEINEEEEVIGRMSDRLKCLFSVYTESRLVLSSLHSGDGKYRFEMLGEMGGNPEEQAHFMSDFVCFVQGEFQRELAHDARGREDGMIRSGFLIVATKSECKKDPMDRLHHTLDLWYGGTASEKLA